MGRLEGKVAIITGAASGFGAEMARRFVTEGARVVVVDITEETGRAVAAELGEAALFQRCDVTVEADMQGAVAAAVKRFGRLDILVANAGYTHWNSPFDSIDEAEFDRTYAVNVKGIFWGARAAVPQFRAQGDGGVMLVVASTAGVRPRPGLSWYNGSKFAAVGLTKSLAVELAPERIRVCALNPVAGETPLLAKFMGEDTPEKRAQFRASVPLGRLSQPSDIANAAVFLCSQEAEFLTGVCLEVDGGRCI